MFPPQPTFDLQSELTEELNTNSGLFWTDDDICSALYDETFRFFESAITTLDGHLTNSDDHLQYSDAECRGWLSEDFNALSLADATMNHETSPSAPATMFNHPLSTSLPHLPIAPTNPSTTVAHEPYFIYTPQASPSSSTSVTSSPPTSPPSSSQYSNSPKSDNELDYTPSDDDDDEEWNPTQSTPYRKRNKRGAASDYKSPRPPRSASSKIMKKSTTHDARRFNPYNLNTPSRNFQCEDKDLLVNDDSGSWCRACGYSPKNGSIHELERHIKTHRRWEEPSKWVCRGVGIDKAHLYRMDIRKGFTEDEFIEAGGYIFEGQLMIGGCLKTFSRPDSLARHLRNLSCVGEMKL